MTVCPLDMYVAGDSIVLYTMIYDIIRKTFDFEHAYKDEKKEIIWVSQNMVTYILYQYIIG